MICIENEKCKTRLHLRIIKDSLNIKLTLEKQIYITTPKTILRVCLNKSKVEPLFTNSLQFKDLGFGSVHVLNEEYLLIGTLQGDILVHNIRSRSFPNTISDRHRSPILFFQKVFTSAENLPLFYSLNAKSRLVCRNDVRSDVNLFEFEPGFGGWTRVLGLHVSVYFNLILVVYKECIALLSVYNNKLIAKLDFSMRLEGKDSRFLCIFLVFQKTCFIIK